MRRIRKEFRFHIVFAYLMVAAVLGSPLLGYYLGPT